MERVAHFARLTTQTDVYLKIEEHNLKLLSKNMIKKLILITVISIISISSEYEPSAYGAGNIDSSSPYGLTQTERSVLNNRKEIQDLKNIVEEQNNKIEGLITIIDGLNREIFILKERIRRNKDSLEKIKDNNKTESMIVELAKLVEQINNNYVTFEDLKGVERRSNLSSQSIENLDISTIYKMGIEEFKKRNYNIAIDYFKKALEQNYKLASSNFYLGEIEFLRENYQDAINYYKRSASIYDKASYMKYLYLHTAISLKRVGDIEKANEFFKFIIDTYPDTKVSRVAKENLLR